jgi:hypothetical protein
MSINNLRKLLADIKYPNDNIGHLKMMHLTINDNSDFQERVKDLYNDCLDYQFQLNLNKQLIRRLQKLLNKPQVVKRVKYPGDFSQDQIRIINGLLLKTLVNLKSSNTASTTQIGLSDTLELFHNLCVNNTSLDNECKNMMLRACSTQAWWGDFINTCLRKYFLKAYMNNTIQLNRIFLFLNDLCIKSLNLNYFNDNYNQLLFKSLFELIIELLDPLNDPSRPFNVEVTAVEWILLFLSRLLNIYDRFKIIQNRWEFLDHVQIQHQNQHQTYAKNTFPSQNTKKFSFYSKANKLISKKKLFKSPWGPSATAPTSSTSSISSNSSSNPSQTGKQSTPKANNLYLMKLLQLPRVEALKLCKLLIKFLLNANSYCSSDLFVIVCRILSSICSFTLPVISLSDILTDDQSLKNILLLCISVEYNHGSVCWGSPWSSHAIMCLLMDLMDIEVCIMNKTKLVIVENDACVNFSEQAWVDIIGPLQPTSRQKSNLAKFLLKSHDLRLNMNCFQTIENYFNQNTVKHVESLNMSINQIGPSIDPSKQKLNLNEFYSNFACSSGADKASRLIQITLEGLFMSPDLCNLENLLNFWLQIMICHSESTAESKLNEILQINFLNYLVDYQFFSVKLWYLVFRFLTLNFSLKNAKVLMQNQCLYSLIGKFLSYQQPNAKNFLTSQAIECTLIGDECCSAFLDFLVHLFKLLTDSSDELRLIVQLLNILNSIVTSTGCVYSNNGAIDAQICFVNFLIAKKLMQQQAKIEKNDDGLNDFHKSLKIFFVNLSNLIKIHIALYPRMSLKGVLSPRSCFSNVLSSLLGSTMTINVGAKNKNGFAKPNSIPPLDNKYLKYFDFKFPASNDSQKITGFDRTDTSSGINTALSVNRDLLICLLIRFAVGLLNTDDSNENEIVTSDELPKQQPRHKDIDLMEENFMAEQLFLYNEFDIQNENDLNEMNFDDWASAIHEVRYKYMMTAEQDEHDTISAINSDCAKKTSKKNIQQSKAVNKGSNQTIGNILSDECLDLLIESLALCQSSALAMVICNSSYVVDINLNDMRTPGDYLFVLLKTIAGYEPAKLTDSIYNYLFRLKRLSEPFIWLLTYLFNTSPSSLATQPKNPEGFVDVLKYFLMNKNGLDVISNGLLMTTKQLLYSGPCVISSLMNHLDNQKQTKTSYLNVDLESTEGKSMETDACV